MSFIILCTYSQSEEDCEQNRQLLEAEMSMVAKGGDITNLLQLDKRGFIASRMGSLIRITGKCRSCLPAYIHAFDIIFCLQNVYW